MTDRNLLFLMVALQLDFISREQMIEAAQAWMLAKDAPIDQLLVQRKMLTGAQRDLLDALVTEHVRQHDDDASRSWAALSAPSSSGISERLRQLGDKDLDASLNRLGTASQDLTPPPLEETIGIGKGTSLGSRFRILRPHAQGGLGQVSVALDHELNREVALKQLQARFADSAEGRARFVQEAEINGSLEHPGIVPVYGLGQDDQGRPFYAMRFVRGDSLKDAIQRYYKVGGVDYQSLEFRKLLGRFVDVCDAVEYAHSRGVLHRDLKPGNVMLGRYGETLIVDWGLAKTVGRQGDELDTTDEETVRVTADSTPTVAGSAIGTPAYMSPEQAAGRLDELGSASDVYSLGATLYTILTGQPPFPPRAADVLQMVQRGEFKPPRQLRPEVPRALSAMCLRAMAPRREDRYPTPRALANDIEHWLADEPVAAHREGVLERSRRWLRKHRAWAAAGLAALVLVAAVSTIAAVAINVKNAEITRLADTEMAARQKAERLQEYFVGVFRSPDPSMGGATITVAEALDQAMEELPESLAAEPRTQGSLLLAIGQTYQGLGLYDRAIVAFQQALPILKRELGENSSEYITAVRELSESHLLAGNPDRGRELAEESVGLAAAASGQKDELQLDCQGTLAEAHRHQGDLKRARELHENVLNRRRQRLGPEHPDTCVAMVQLAATLYELGELRAATDLLETAVPTLRQSLGETDPTTLNAASDLALFYLQAGQHEEARRLYESNVKLITERHGEEHPSTLSALNNQAMALFHMGQFAEAAATFERALAGFRKRLGPRHAETILVLNNLGVLYKDLNDLERAIPMLREAYEAQLEVQGPDAQNTLISLSSLGAALKLAGQLDEALPLLKEAHERFSANFGADHQNSLTATVNYALALRQAGQVEQAIELLEGAASRSQQELGDSHPQTVQTLRELAKSYHLAGRYTDAVVVRRQLVEIERGREAPDAARLTDSLAHLGLALTLEKGFVEAEAVLRECFQLRQANFPGQADTYDAQSMLGEAIAKQGRYDDAEPLLLEAYDKLSQHAEASREMHLMAVLRIIDLYTARGKTEQAQQWQERLSAPRPGANNKGGC